MLLAKLPPGWTGDVPAAAGLGEDLEPLLPYREDRPDGWHRRGITTTAGYALWDTGVAETGAIREIVLIAAADRESRPKRMGVVGREGGPASVRQVPDARREAAL